MQSINQVVTANKQEAKASTTSKPSTENPTKGQYFALAQQLIPGFEVDDDNRELLRLLYAYAVRDAYFTQQGFNLDKGLLLYGNVGSGKTAQMKVLQRAFNILQSPLAFAYGTVAQVADSFGVNGFEAFLAIAKKNYLFDELGRLDRETVQWFGNKVNIAESLIQNRYELFARGILTHFTTNLSLDELETHYDERAWSRLQEMCNLVEALAPDRRPEAKTRRLDTPKIIQIVPAYTDEMKKQTILAEVENIRAGTPTEFLDVGGLHFAYLQEKGLITAAQAEDIEAEEYHNMVKRAKLHDLNSSQRKALRQFEEAEELPPDNPYTKRLAFLIEKRLLKEALHGLATYHLTL